MLLFESNVTSYLNKFRNKLRISSLNINSLDKRFADILFLLNGQLVDVLVINETKLNEKHDDSTFDHPCFENYRLDRQNSGGGAVLVYVKKKLNPSRVTFDDHSEMISFIITIEKQLIGILACYRPPYTANETNFFSSLNKQLNNFEDLKTSEILIVGDLNFNMDNFQHSSKLSDFNSKCKMTAIDVILSSSPASCLSSKSFHFRVVIIALYCQFLISNRLNTNIVPFRLAA